LEQLQQELDSRQQPSDEPSEPSEPVTTDNMMPPEPSDEPSEPGEPSDNPLNPEGEWDIVDELREQDQPSTPSDGPYSDLTDEELQRLIEEIKELLKNDDPVGPPQPGDEPPTQPSEPSDETGPGQNGGGGTQPNTGQGGESTAGMPPSPMPSPDLERTQSWMWLNLGDGSYANSPVRPNDGFVHMLWMPNAIGSDIMTFGGIQDVMTANGINFTAFRPTPAEAYLEFPDFQSYSAATSITQTVCDEYMLFELDDSTNSIIYTYSLVTEDGPENRWVPDLNQEVQDTSGDAARNEISDMIEQMQRDSQAARDAGIPSGYGEASTNEYVESAGVESNADRQASARDAGATAGQSQAQQDATDRSNNAASARQAAQSAANAAERAANAGDADTAAESAVRAVEEAMRANANANPTSEADAAAVQAAKDAANRALETMATSNPDMEALAREISEDLEAMELGQGISPAQAAAEAAAEAAEMAAQSAEAGNMTDAIMAAQEAISAAMDARQEAIMGDTEDRNAVAEADASARAAIESAAEAGWEEAGAWEQLLNQQPQTDLSEAAANAEARNRDTMPGEFADAANESVAEDMQAVAEEAVRNAIEAMQQANPADPVEDDAIDYINRQANQTLENAGSQWGADVEDAAAELQQAQAEYQSRKNAICGVWEAGNSCWYRDATGKILIFSDSESALIWAVKNQLITDSRVIARLPENWMAQNPQPVSRRDN